MGGNGKCLKNGGLPEAVRRRTFFAGITIISFVYPFIIWFFIGYWILNGAEFPFWPFFFAWPFGKSRSRQKKSNDGATRAPACGRHFD